MNRSFRRVQKYKNRLTDPILPRLRVNFDGRNGSGDKRTHRYVKATGIDIASPQSKIEFITPRSHSTIKNEKFFYLVENSNVSIFKKPESNSFLSETRKKDLKNSKRLNLRIILPNMPRSYLNF